MATKIRLQRHGRKGYAFYSIVIADSRAPRDGKFTEKIGTYNPNTNPATVDLNFDSALNWVLKGAQPTDTVRNILSREGVYMKKHLLGGVAKGAFGEAEAEVKFEAWKKNKQTGLESLKAKQEEAAVIRGRYALLVVFLRQIVGVNTEQAGKDACLLEHQLSQETISKMKTLVQRSYETDRKNCGDKVNYFTTMIGSNIL